MSSFFSFTIVELYLPSFQPPRGGGGGGKGGVISLKKNFLLDWIELKCDLFF